MRAALLLSSALLLLLPQAAHASWDWDDDLPHWRAHSLGWASSVHPDHPTFAWLQANQDPPPDEPWCHEGGSPAPDDCVELEARLDDWLHDYLELAPNMSVPPWMIDVFPHECESVCSAY